MSARSRMRSRSANRANIIPARNIGVSVETASACSSGEKKTLHERVRVITHASRWREEGEREGRARNTAAPVNPAMRARAHHLEIATLTPRERIACCAIPPPESRRASPARADPHARSRTYTYIRVP